MSDNSTFISRTGKLDCPAADVYNFVTDIRNFEQFIPHDKISNIEISQETFSFQASPLGLVNISITEKIMYSRVVYSGSTMLIKDFSLVIIIDEVENNHSEVKILIKAEMNPLFKMMAAEPIKKFLETLICEMEKFKGWKDTK